MGVAQSCCCSGRNMGVDEPPAPSTRKNFRPIKQQQQQQYNNNNSDLGSHPSVPTSSDYNYYDDNDYDYDEDSFENIEPVKCGLCGKDGVNPNDDEQQCPACNKPICLDCSTSNRLVLGADSNPIRVCVACYVASVEEAAERQAAEYAQSPSQLQIHRQQSESPEDKEEVLREYLRGLNVDPDSEDSRLWISNKITELQRMLQTPAKKSSVASRRTSTPTIQLLELEGIRHSFTREDNNDNTINISNNNNNDNNDTTTPTTTNDDVEGIVEEQKENK